MAAVSQPWTQAKLYLQIWIYVRHDHHSFSPPGSILISRFQHARVRVNKHIYRMFWRLFVRKERKANICPEVADTPLARYARDLPGAGTPSCSRIPIKWWEEHAI